MKGRRQALAALTALALAGCSLGPLGVRPSPSPSSSAPRSVRPASPDGIGKIQHVVVIMQENRSFDQYFGTYPGANGFPTKDGKFSVCVNDPKTRQCVYPFHDPANRNLGGPHSQGDATADINGGRMDGFIAQADGAKAGCAGHA